MKLMRSLPRASVVIVCLLISHVAETQEASPKTPADAVLWSDPGDIHARNLYWGIGGEDRQPKLPVEFVKEDTGGTNPKFDVRDSADHKWKAKLGLEAKPEAAAARLMWAIGYTANENYFLHELEVKNMPPKLHRGQTLIGKDGTVSDVRLQRPPHDYKKSGDWDWRHNPFYGTREFNGLRIMMGLIANWDLKNDNNAILENEKTPSPKIYEVTDVGTAFGTVGKSYTNRVSKNNLRAYQQTRLIARVHGDYIDLNFPKRPPLLDVFDFRFFFHQVRMRWVGKHIPRADAEWIGSLLAQLTPDQIHDAFRAAGYSPAEVHAYSNAVLSRIKELNDL